MHSGEILNNDIDFRRGRIDLLLHRERRLNIGGLSKAVSR